MEEPRRVDEALGESALQQMQPMSGDRHDPSAEQANPEHRQATFVLDDSSARVVNQEHQQAASSLDDGSQERHVVESKKRLMSDAEEKSSSSNRSKERRMQWLLLWWPEMLAIVLSTAFFVAVLILLISIHDTPLGDWSAPFGIKPNTLVALFVTICQLFLVAVLAQGLSQLKWVYFEQQPHQLVDLEHFDSASRGALGAVQFLYRIRWRALVGSAGALITILSLAMEPFAQQTLSFYNKRLDGRNLSATLPYATSYDTYSILQVNPYTDQMPAQARGHYAGMLGSMLEGLYNPKASVQFACKTGNCTWPAFETLGLCSNCKDVTSSLNSSCSYSNKTMKGLCTYRTPGGARLDARCGEFAGGTFYTLWKSSIAEDSIQYPEVLTIAALQYPSDNHSLMQCGYGLNFGHFPPPKPQTTECKLSWCARTYQSRVVNGTLQEDLLSTRELVFPKNTCPNNQYYHSNLVGPNWAISDNDIVVLNAAFTPDNLPKDLCSGWQNRKNSAFWLNWQDLVNLGQMVKAVFETSYESGGGQLFGQLLYSVNEADLSKDIANMAESMTKYVRQGPNSTLANGTVWYEETYIRVNWLWLVYPAALVVMGMGFLVASVVFSAERSRVVWKSSSLALLFHGLEGWDTTIRERSTSDMKQNATQMFAQLTENDEGDLSLIKR